MSNVLLGVTGSVASIRTPSLFRSLHEEGYHVKIVATQASLYFFDPKEIAPGATQLAQRNPEYVVLDEDEWPGRVEGRLYQRNDEVLHIELRRWADLLLIAPLDANTLAKLANGLADNCLACVCRAWDRQRPVMLAPAMNTMMWEHPLTQRHLRQVAEIYGGGNVPEDIDLLQLIHVINENARCLSIVPPQSKRLACDDVGMGAMAEVENIVAAVKAMLPP